MGSSDPIESATFCAVSSMKTKLRGLPYMRRKIPLLLLCLLFLGIAIYAGSQFWGQWKEYKAGEETYDTLSQYIQLAEPPPMSTEQTGPPGQSSETAESTAEPQLAETIPTDGTYWPVVDFEMLQEINPDVVAWIYLEGTEINYPGEPERRVVEVGICHG